MVAIRRSVRLSPSDMTVPEFLDWADGVEGRYELVDGRPRAMAPTSTTHGTLHAALTRLIENHLIATDSPCRTLVAPGVQPRVRADYNFRIPDLGVACEPDKLGARTMENAILLIEILSPSNKRKTWTNVWSYCTIPSVREILILNAVKIAADLLRRQSDGSWPERPVRLGPDDEVVLESFGLRLPLVEIYARTDLAGPAR